MNTTKRLIKVVSVIVLVLVLSMIMGNMVFAAAAAGTTGSLDESYLDPGKITVPGDNDVITTTQNITGTVIGVIQVVGITFAVAMLIFVAIKYLTSAAEGKAEIKKYAVAYIVGAFLLFGVSGILQLFKSFTTSALTNK